MPPPSSPVDVQYSCQEDTNQQQSTTLIDFFTACGDPAIIISLDDYRIEHANDAFLRDISPGILHEKRYVHPSIATILELPLTIASYPRCYFQVLCPEFRTR